MSTLLPTGAPAPAKPARDLTARRDWLVLLAALLSLATIAIYAGLIPIGTWQADEYDTQRAFRSEGFFFLVRRIYGWSYRPLSEGLLFLYELAVRITGRQLITSFLGALWLCLIAGALLPALVGGNTTERAFPSPLLLALSLAVFVLFLGSGEIAEMFYWPQAAAAYLPALAGMTLATLLAAYRRQETMGEALLLAAGLSVAALSAEVGAMFVAIFVPGHLVLLVLWRLRARSRPPLRAADLVQFVPLAMAGGVLWLMAGGRLGIDAEIFGDRLVAHSLLGSVAATLARFPLEIMGLAASGADPGRTVAGLAAKLLVGLGAFLAFRRREGARDPERLLKLAALALAGLGAGFVSLLGAFYQFGLACCQRHQTLRECLSILAIVALARIASIALGPSKSRWARGRARQRLPAVLLTVAALAVVLPNAGRLARSYAVFVPSVEARAANWKAGRSASRAMVLEQPPIGPVTGGAQWPLGTFVQNSETPAYMRMIMDYFGKDEVTVRPFNG